MYNMKRELYIEINGGVCIGEEDNIICAERGKDAGIDVGMDAGGYRIDIIGG